MAQQYLPPEIFKAEYEKCRSNDVCSNQLIFMFEKIAKNYYKKLPQLSTKDNQAIIAYGTSQAWRKWKSYDKNVSGNLFAFFTQMIRNDMITHFNKITEGKAKKDYGVQFVYMETLFSNKNGDS